MFYNSRRGERVPDGFVPVRLHNRTVITLVAVCCLSIGIAIGSVARGIAGANKEDNHLVISENNLSPDALSAAFARTASRVEPCVVHIGVTDDQPLGAFAHEDTGSGIIVNSSGYILTNQHVLEHPTKIRVKLFNGNEYDAKIVGEDSETDLAVIKIDAHESLPTATMGDSEKLKVGDWVLAIGSPFGYDQTVTAGIISAKDRVTNEKWFYRQFLQTDAAINPGNSGGPLVNLAGEVVGINSLIATRTWVYNGIGFALPSSTAVNIYNQLVQYGRVRRGFLGIQLQALTPQIARQNGLPNTDGVLVGNVTAKESPAARAGIQSEDVILAINGKKVKDIADLIRKIGVLPVGSLASVTFVRAGQQHTVSVRLDERTEEADAGEPDVKTPGPGAPRVSESPEPEGSRGIGTPGSAISEAPPKTKDGSGAAEADSPLRPTFGLTVRSLTRDKAKKLGMEGAHGALVTELERGSLAWSGGLQTGDLVVEINRRPVSDVEDFIRMTRQFKSGDDVVIRVIRRAALGTSPPVSAYIASFSVP